jgi:hypothetical protein
MWKTRDFRSNKDLGIDSNKEVQEWSRHWSSLFKLGTHQSRSSSLKYLGPSAPSGLKRKEEAMTRVTNSMTKTSVASKERHDKRTEQMKLGRDTTTIYVSLCSLPESADGNTARVFMNKKIRISNARMEQITNLFDDNPSPSNTP